MTPTERLVSHKVLLVDDNDDVLGMMRELLESNGFEVVAVGDVTEALKRIATQSFQMLITDLHMPNAGDGFTVSLPCDTPNQPH
jgi:CheY-like chemotaxis protein